MPQLESLQHIASPYSRFRRHHHRPLHTHHHRNLHTHRRRHHHRHLLSHRRRHHHQSLLMIFQEYLRQDLLRLTQPFAVLNLHSLLLFSRPVRRSTDISTAIRADPHCNPNRTFTPTQSIHPEWMLAAILVFGWRCDVGCPKHTLLVAMTAMDGNKIGAMLHVYCIFTYYINILQSYGILVFHIHPIFGWHLLSSFYEFTYYFSHTYAGILRRNFIIFICCLYLIMHMT